MDRYTSGSYARDNPDWHDGDAPHKAAGLARVIRSVGWRPATVADVGCGTGAVLHRLSRELRAELPDTRWEGWDPAPEAARGARRHEGEGVTFVEGDFTVSDRRVDLALLVDVVEHVADDVAFLAAVAERADRLLLRLPLDLSALDVLRPRRMLEARRRYGHLHAWTRELALQTLREAGLEVVHERYDRRPGAPRGLDRARAAAFPLRPHATVRLLGGFSLLVCARRA